MGKNLKSALEKLKWKEYYLLEENVIEYIQSHSLELANNSSFDLEKGKIKYARMICYVDDDKVMLNLKKKLNELKSKYFDLIGKKTNRLSRNFPIIINDVENINITFNDAIESTQVNRITKKNLDTEYFLSLVDEESPEFSLVQKLNSKHNLILKKQITDIENWISVYITGKELLDITNADILQIHRYTGKQCILNVRKEKEQRSKRYKYGVIVLDKKPVVNMTNKEATRIHRLANTIGRFELEFETALSIYIKKKRSEQMNMFEEENL